MMQYKDYLGKVEFDPDAKILHGEVVGIRDVVTFQGRSVKEVEKAFRESVDDYLAFCKQRGERPDAPFSGQFLMRINPGLHRRLTMLAQAQGKSLNALVAEILNRQIDEAFKSSSSATDPKLPRKVKKTTRPRKKASAKQNRAAA